MSIYVKRVKGPSPVTVLFIFDGGGVEMELPKRKPNRLPGMITVRMEHILLPFALMIDKIYCGKI